MRKIIITGATSFIGIHLIRKLLKEDVRIYAVVRPDSKKIKSIPVNENVKVVELDMHEYGLLAERIPERCDVMYALAWNGTRGEARADGKRQKENYRASMQSVKCAYNLGCTCIISAGSQAEYGNIQGMIREDMTAMPNTEYGKWKYQFYIDAYKYCKENHISFKEPRFFSLYGEGDYEGTMIISILKQMVENTSCKLTEGIQKWDFLYIEDAIDAIITLGKQRCEDGAYNLGSGDTRTLKEFIQEMYRLTESKSTLQFGAIPYPDTGMVSIAPDITKLKREICFNPRVSFKQGIENILKTYEKSDEKTNNEKNIGISTYIQ